MITALFFGFSAIGAVLWTFAAYCTWDWFVFPWAGLELPSNPLIIYGILFSLSMFFAHLMPGAQSWVAYLVQHGYFEDPSKSKRAFMFRKNLLGLHFVTNLVLPIITLAWGFLLQFFV